MKLAMPPSRKERSQGFWVGHQIKALREVTALDGTVVPVNTELRIVYGPSKHRNTWGLDVHLPEGVKRIELSDDILQANFRNLWAEDLQKEEEMESKLAKIASKLLDKGFVEEAREVLAFDPTDPFNDQEAIHQDYLHRKEQALQEYEESNYPAEPWTTLLSTIKQALKDLEKKVPDRETSDLYDEIERLILEFR